MAVGKIVIDIEVAQLEKAKELILQLRKLGLSKRALNKIIKFSRKEN